MIKKIVWGCVIQELDDSGRLLSQSFHADDLVEYEGLNGIDFESLPYYPYDMVQVIEGGI